MKRVLVNGSRLAGAIAIVALLAVTSLRAEGVATQAQPPAAFATCKACHPVTKGSAATFGPNLFATVNTVAATKPNYTYSPALKASKLRWTRATLDAYLADPKALVPGTKMAIPGVKDPAKRKEIVDYLEKLE